MLSVFYVHVCWMIFFILVTLIFLIISFFTFFHTFIIRLSVFSSWFFQMHVSISIDMFSSWFSFVVCFIRSVIMLYSYFYISPYYKPNYFIWLTVFFVLSILIVINFSNLFFIMLGWDGLGLVSFFLIVYYQNFSSISSGLFTVLINRIGDCFFIVRISLFFFLYPFHWTSNFLPSFLPSFLLLLTFITKRAIFPFSPWLPLAMAAPTPISALVHSSTLVTAGLYLIMRFSYVFYFNHFLIYFLLVFCVFTSFYAGLNSIFETDIKKLIALSTLSHLGFIGIAFSSGLLFLSFFHLLVHALFKSVLFISIGDIITNIFHSQDIRFLSFGLHFTPASCFVMYVSLINLLGLPSIRGYYSKDLVLETRNFSNTSFFIIFIIFINVIFTYYYTYRLFYFSFRSVKLSPYINIHTSTGLHYIFMLLISLLSIVFGIIWINYINFYIIHVLVPEIWKLTPYFLNFFIFIFLLINLNLLTLKNQFFNFYFSNIIFLSCFIITLISNFYVKISFNLSKSVEYGIFNSFLNKNVSLLFSSLSVWLFKFSSINSILTILFFSSFCFLFFMI